MSSDASPPIREVVELRKRVLLDNLRYLSVLARRLDLAVTDVVAVAYLDDGIDTPGGVARALAMTSASATALCDRLEATGVLRRARHPTDRRRVVLNLTSRGRRLARRFSEYVAADVQPALSHLHQEDWASVITFIDALREVQARHVEEPLASRKTATADSEP